MAIAYFDCFAGAAGDMIVASLLDAGADLDTLSAALAGLGLEGVSLETSSVRRGAMAATKFDVIVPDTTEGPHRHLGSILSLIDSAGLARRAAERARRIFNRLAEAEAKVHGIDVEEVHFHEVGAADSIIDIVGACVALELLEIDQVFCSPITVGNGTVKCAHGTLPVPAPATAMLLRGAKTAPSEINGEATTPTGAAILTTLSESFGPLPAMEVCQVGCGAGTREGGPLPNILRVFVGAADDNGRADTVVELSANIDDCSGEIIGATIESLLQGGCLDAWAEPIFMKKSRPAWMLSVLCAHGDVASAEEILFSETTTFGIRRRQCSRSKLARRWQSVETTFGPVRIKIGELNGREMTASPEFSDCASAAKVHHVPIKEVFRQAIDIYRRKKQT